MNNWIPPKAPLIILGAGPQQLPVYEVAKRLGIKTLAVDFNPNAEARNLSDFFVLASVRDSDECIRGLEATGLNFSGVITCGVEVSPQVSRIALHFGLQGIPEEVAIKTTHKGLRLQALYDGKIPIPDFRRLNRAEVPDLDFPFVVKPSDSSGSRGVQQVTNKEEFQQAFSEAASISSDGDITTPPACVPTFLRLPSKAEKTASGLASTSSINSVKSALLLNPSIARSTLAAAGESFFTIIHHSPKVLYLKKS